MIFFLSSILWWKYRIIFLSFITRLNVCPILIVRWISINNYSIFGIIRLISQIISFEVLIFLIFFTTIIIIYIYIYLKRLTRSFSFQLISSYTNKDNLTTIFPRRISLTRNLSWNERLSKISDCHLASCQPEAWNFLEYTCITWQHLIRIGWNMFVRNVTSSFFVPIETPSSFSTCALGLYYYAIGWLNNRGAVGCPASPLRVTLLAAVWHARGASTGYET